MLPCRMRFTLLRYLFATDFTLGKLFVTYDGPLGFDRDGWRVGAPKGPLLFGYMAEDSDRGLHTSLPLEVNTARKVAKVTCIPATDGAEPYVLSRTWSNRFHERTPDGKMVLVHDTPAFRGIRWHPGKNARWSEGCQLPGLRANEARGEMISTDEAWKWLDARVGECDARKERVLLDVHRDPTAWATAPFNPDR